MKWLSAVVWLAVALSAAAPFSLRADEAGKKRILTSILPVYCFAKNVAGEQAEVENLLPGGVGPHDYQLSPRDLAKITRADLILLNGLELESWIEGVIRSNRKENQVVRVSDGLDKELIHADEHDHDHAHAGHDHHHHATDPHIWLDPRLARHCVTNILQAFQKADPANAERYAENARIYLERLTKLDADIEQSLAPVKSAGFVTYHNAFGYFVRRYELNLVGVVEEVPDVEPTPKYLSNLGKTVRSKKAKALFTEPQFSSRLVQQLARDWKIKVGELDPLETGSLTGTAYEEGMRKNLKSLQEALR